MNSHLLYKGLADYVVTTSSCIIPVIQAQSRLPSSRIRCVSTGVDPAVIKADPEEVKRFRSHFIKNEDEILVGTACFVRSWKGVQDLMQAAKIVKEQDKRIKWVVIGGGHVKDYMSSVDTLGIKDVLSFTGHLESPYAAIGALDIFALLSTAHEGVSQASLQAAYLQRPLITTSIGGLPEVCIQGETGLIVPPFSPEKVAEAVLQLANDPALRKTMGENAKSS